MTNYKKLRSEKLQEMLQTADEHEAIQIISVLKDRGIGPKLPEKTEAKQGAAPAPAAESEVLGEAVPAEKTDEDVEFEKKIKACEANTGHRCKVVPFNTVEWVDGVILGVASDAKAKRISYAIKTDAGKRMLKSVDSKLIKISEETVDLNTVVRKRPSGNSKGDRTEETLQNDIAAALPNVGKQLVIDENTSARIDGLLIDRRTMRIMYKFKDPTTGGQKFKTYSADIEINDFANDADREHGVKYAENFKPGGPVSKADRLAKIKASIERYKEQLAKWDEEVKKLEAELAAEPATENAE